MRELEFQVWGVMAASLQGLDYSSGCQQKGKSVESQPVWFDHTDVFKMNIADLIGKS